MGPRLRSSRVAMLQPGARGTYLAQRSSFTTRCSAPSVDKRCPIFSVYVYVYVNIHVCFCVHISVSVSVSVSASVSFSVSLPLSL
jgi:hypothetical protein